MLRSAPRAQNISSKGGGVKDESSDEFTRRWVISFHFLFVLLLGPRSPPSSHSPLINPLQLRTNKNNHRLRLTTSRTFSEEEVSLFARLCGDSNPLHQGRQSSFPLLQLQLLPPLPLPPLPRSSSRGSSRPLCSRGWSARRYPGRSTCRSRCGFALLSDRERGSTSRYQCCRRGFCPLAE